MPNSMDSPSPKQQKNSDRWPVLAAIVLVLVGSLACRLQVGLNPEASAKTQPVVSLPQTAAKSAVAPARRVEAVAQKPEPTSLPSSPTPSPTSTPAPTSTPTFAPVLVPTTTSSDETGPTPSPTPGIPPTPTPIPLIPARYPPHKIIIPAINLDAPVEPAGWIITEHNGLASAAWDVPDNAAGWHKNSALPGHGTNVVLSGHHNIKGEVFKDLVKVNVGDEIILQADAYAYHYVVTDRFIVPERDAPEEQRRQNAQWILPTIDERVTLVTCWPYTDNSHRLIVVAKPVGFNEL